MIPMKMDELIKQRFSELDEKANKGITYRGSDGEAVNYEKFHEWATNVLNLLQRSFGEDNPHYRNFSEHYKAFNGWAYNFEICRGVFRAAKEDYDGGYLFNFRSLIKAEVLSDDVLDQAKELLANGYKDPSCVLVGVALEVTLKEMCTKAGIPQGKLDKMNADLCKAGKYNMAKQKQITAWADLRNKAAHGEWADYNQADVSDFMNGVERFIADFL
jgi:hypothetical protein